MQRSRLCTCSTDEPLPAAGVVQLATACQAVHQLLCTGQRRWRLRDAAAPQGLCLHHQWKRLLGACDSLCTSFSAACCTALGCAQAVCAAPPHMLDLSPDLKMQAGSQQLALAPHSRLPWLQRSADPQGLTLTIRCQAGYPRNACRMWLMKGAAQSSRVRLTTWKPALLYMAAAAFVSATCTKSQGSGSLCLPDSISTAHHAPKVLVKAAAICMMVALAMWCSAALVDTLLSTCIRVGGGGQLAKANSVTIGRLWRGKHSI